MKLTYQGCKWCRQKKCWISELLEDKMHDPIDTNTAVGKAKFFYKICLNESKFSLSLFIFERMFD